MSKLIPVDFRKLKCYMDGIDWQHELAHDPNGTKLFPSIESLKKNNATHDPEEDGCGIVEVEVRLIRWVVKQDLDKPDRKRDKPNVLDDGLGHERG